MHLDDLSLFYVMFPVQLRVNLFTKKCGHINSFFKQIIDV